MGAAGQGQVGDPSVGLGVDEPGDQLAGDGDREVVAGLVDLDEGFYVVNIGHQ